MNTWYFLIVWGITLFWCLTAKAAPSKFDGPVNLDILIPALIEKESGGNNQALGDNGQALGCLQIHRVVVADYNEAHPNGQFTWSQMANRVVAIVVCHWYLTHYERPQLRGGVQTYEDAARIWNGGPDGWRKSSTVAYWKAVKVILERQNP